LEEKITQYATEIILALIGLLVVYVKIWLDKLKKKAEAYYEARTTAAHREIIAGLGAEAFAFAETVFRDLKGPDKLAEAVKYMEDKARRLGINIAFEEARAAVEKAWLEDKRKEVPVGELVEIRAPAVTE
jgi:hypothetical protein